MEAVYLILLIIFIPMAYAAVIGAPTLPSRRKNVREALRQAGVTEGTRFFELGTGGGGVSKKALKMGAEVTGYELSPVAFIWSFVNLSTTKKPFKLKAKNFFKEDLSRAEVIYVFLMPDPLKKLKKKLEKETAPGTKIISYAFPIPDWTPIREISEKGSPTIYVYEVCEKREKREER